MPFPSGQVAGKVLAAKKKKANPFAKKAPNATQKEPNTGGGLPWMNPTKPSKKKKAPMQDYDEDGM